MYLLWLVANWSLARFGFREVVFVIKAKPFSVWSLCLIYSGNKGYTLRLSRPLSWQFAFKVRQLLDSELAFVAIKINELPSQRYGLWTFFLTSTFSLWLHFMLYSSQVEGHKQMNRIWCFKKPFINFVLQEQNYSLK